MPTLDLQCEILPQPYVATRDQAILEQNARVTLPLLGLGAGDRQWMVVVDETVWAPAWDVCFNLRRDAPMCIVGGWGEHSYIPRQKSWEEGAEELADDKLAHLWVHHIVTRTDTNKHTYCISITPREPGRAKTTAALTFKEFGLVLEAGTTANGAPPIAAAFDNGGFLGCVPEKF